MTSKDILRALRVPLEDFTNEAAKILTRFAGEPSTITVALDYQTLLCVTGERSYGVVSIGMTEPPLLPAITLQVNAEVYENVPKNFKRVFKHSTKSRTGGGTSILIKLGAYDVDQYSDAGPYYPLRKYRGEVGSTHKV